MTDMDENEQPNNQTEACEIQSLVRKQSAENESRPSDCPLLGASQPKAARDRSPKRQFLQLDEDIDISVVSVQSSMSVMGGGFPAFKGASGRGSREDFKNQANSASHHSPFRNYQDNSIIVEGELQSPNGTGISQRRALRNGDYLPRSMMQEEEILQELRKHSAGGEYSKSFNVKRGNSEQVSRYSQDHKASTGSSAASSNSRQMSGLQSQLKRLVDKTQKQEETLKSNNSKMEELKAMVALVDSEVTRLTQLQREELRKQRKLKRDLNFVTQFRSLEPAVPATGSQSVF